MRKTSLIFSIVALFVFLMFWGGVYYLTRFFPNTQERLQRKVFHSAVVLNRDRYGVPVIESDSRIEMVKAQGLATARDRFFQMELIRRKMAGRLSELFGEKALETDEWHRRLGFELVAQKSVSLMDSTTREVWESYAQGVNDYLSHETLPWEISLLGYAPESWKPEDSLLVVLSLFDALNDPKNSEELAYNELNRVFPKKLVNFLTWDYGFFDAPLRIPKGFSLEAKIPTPVEWNVRSQSFRSKDILLPEKNVNGSNAWVVAGNKTVTGKPLLAGDPHLNLSVPNIWYRSELKTK
ncbi:MAG: penicillin acylase family protein, partial [Deltaproteobacteria bacterium]